jgi:23S rRNA (adenine2503-C2)-methyltransferase
MQMKNLKGLTLGELEEFAVASSEPKYRGRQLFDWLYAKEVSSFAEMTSISRSFRRRLESRATIDSMGLVRVQESGHDGTTKFLFELSDGKRIETVLIPPKTSFMGSDADDDEEQRRLTLCISTQVGCPLDCTFCATATMGFLRNLTPGEIVDQLLQVRKICGKKVTNLVYMGMGEPLLNYENVMKSVEIMTTGMGIAPRRITVSTAGWVPGIRQMADERRKVKLAVSLHTLDDDLRTDLMPVNKKYGLDELLDATGYYYRKVKRPVTFEYILFGDFNDRDEDIARLVKLSKDVQCKINIIPFHAIGVIRPGNLSAALRPASSVRTDEFVRKLREARVAAFVRSSAGVDIDAACGQLAARAEQKRRASIISSLQYSPIS